MERSQSKACATIKYSEASSRIWFSYYFTFDVKKIALFHVFCFRNKKSRNFLLQQIMNCITWLLKLQMEWLT